jgi:hypothetical protein
MTDRIAFRFFPGFLVDAPGGARFVTREQLGGRCVSDENGQRRISTQT